MRLFLPLALLPLRVLAWGAAGHEIVATIAQIHLHPSAYPTICSILGSPVSTANGPPCLLATVATWADRIRYRMHWSGPLHYVGAVGDHPPDTCNFPGDHGWDGSQDANVLSATRNVSNILADYVRNVKLGASTSVQDTERANEALKFLIHFLGDLHQPLHLTGRDRGGNGDKVMFDRRHTNLHSVWDTFLISKALRHTPRKYNHPLPDKRIEYSLRGAIYDPYVRQIMVEGVLRDWADEIPAWLQCPPRNELQFGNRWQQVLSTWLRTSDPGARTDDETLCPYAWAKPIHALNCDIVWPKALDDESYKGWLAASVDNDVDDDDDAEAMGGKRKPHRDDGLQLDTPEYAGEIEKRRLIEKLLAQAGVRLANTLNYLFADDNIESNNS
ncbi:hypothetical protein AX14_000845 [Amanita brunnescens Koide BX004]|nr:hypothetical protein AX14_000845 [Amanita brunnescens Koide BX004]